MLGSSSPIAVPGAVRSSSTSSSSSPPLPPPSSSSSLSSSAVVMAFSPPPSTAFAPFSSSSLSSSASSSASASPNVAAPLYTQNPALLAAVNQFVTRLKRRQVVGSYFVATETAVILKNLVIMTRWSSAAALIHAVREVGRVICEAQSLELSGGNIVRRVLRIIRDEANPNVKPDSEPSLSIRDSVNAAAKAEPSVADLKATLTEAIGLITDELDNLYRSVATLALEHIHSNEVIMTYGSSKTVTQFLINAGRKRKFQVIVPETAPSYVGHSMALQLSKEGIDTTVIPDSGIFAMMSRVNKVILGAHAVLANGGILSHSGSHMVAVCAKHYSTPVVVLTGLYKLTPVYAFDQDTFNSIESSTRVLDYDLDVIDKVSVVNPIYDYVPQELVSLFVTNQGGHSPFYIYRLLNELYNPLDYTL